MVSNSAVGARSPLLGEVGAPVVTLNMLWLCRRKGRASGGEGNLSGQALVHEITMVSMSAVGACSPLLGERHAGTKVCRLLGKRGRSTESSERSDCKHSAISTHVTLHVVRTKQKRQARRNPDGSTCHRRTEFPPSRAQTILVLGSGRYWPLGQWRPTRTICSRCLLIGVSFTSDHSFDSSEQ